MNVTKIYLFLLTFYFFLYFRREAKEGEGDRAAYRRAAGEGADKAADAGPGAAPMEFRGGYGRGKPAQ